LRRINWPPARPAEAEARRRQAEEALALRGAQALADQSLHAQMLERLTAQLGALTADAETTASDLNVCLVVVVHAIHADYNKLRGRRHAHRWLPWRRSARRRSLARPPPKVQPWGSSAV
jgi:hypothetical protein